MGKEELEFIRKWGKPTFGEYWLSTTDSCYWAASYKMPIDQLTQMSKEFILLPCRWSDSSSYKLAEQTLVKNYKGYLTYGIAALYS